MKVFSYIKRKPKAKKPKAERNGGFRLYPILAFGFTMLSVLLAVPACVAAEAEEVYIYKTVLMRPEAPITVDGDLSDWEEFDVRAQAMENLVVGVAGLYEPSDSTDLSGNFRCILDRDNIYLAIVVHDDTLVFGEEDFGKYWNDDSVEIYLDGDLVPPSEKKGFVRADGWDYDYDANDAQIRISKDSTGKVVMDGFGMFGQRPLPLPGLWESLWIVAAFKETPGGYTVEVKIPKIVFISTPFKVGIEIGLGVMVYDDDDGGGADSKISWTADPESIAWKSTEPFGRLLIERESSPY